MSRGGAKVNARSRASHVGPGFGAVGEIAIVWAFGFTFLAVSILLHFPLRHYLKGPLSENCIDSHETLFLILFLLFLFLFFLLITPSAPIPHTRSRHSPEAPPPVSSLHPPRPPSGRTNNTNWSSPQRINPLPRSIPSSRPRRKKARTTSRGPEEGRRGFSFASSEKPSSTLGIYPISRLPNWRETRARTEAKGYPHHTLFSTDSTIFLFTAP